MTLEAAMVYFILNYSIPRILGSGSNKWNTRTFLLVFSNRHLTSITLPHTITKIESSAFTNANNLSSLTIYATTPPILEGDPFINTETQITIYVPAESLTDYQNT